MHSTRLSMTSDMRCLPMVFSFSDSEIREYDHDHVGDWSILDVLDRSGGWPTSLARRAAWLHWLMYFLKD